MKTLQHFLSANKQTIAKLHGMKSIMRVEKARTVEWWLVLPAVGNSDSRCVFIDRATWSCASRKQKTILGQYAERILADQPANA